MNKRIYQKPYIQSVKMEMLQMIAASGSGGQGGSSQTITDITGDGGNDDPGYGGGNGEARSKRNHFTNDPFDTSHFWDPVD